MSSAKLPVKMDSSSALQGVIADGPVDEKQASSVLQAALNRFLQDKTSGRIGFADVPSDELMLQTLREAAAPYQKTEVIVVVGVGGSSLGLQATAQALFGTYARECPRRKGVKPIILIDTIEPDTVSDALNLVGKRRALVVAVSKSGNTMETLAVLEIIRKRFAKRPDVSFVAITGPQGGTLRDLALKNSWSILDVPQNVGGRYSVLTAVGLFPLLVAGADVAAMLRGAAAVEKACRDDNPQHNPAARLAGVLQAWITRGFSQCVCLPYADRLRYVADWMAQLWGESLGKRLDLAGREVRNGTTLIKGLGVLDQHSQLQLYLDGPRDKMILFISVDRFDTDGGLSELLRAEREATRAVLSQSSRPSVELSLSQIDEESLGALLQWLMNSVALLGYHQNINPFDQPAVEAIKHLTREKLRRG